MFQVPLWSVISHTIDQCHVLKSGQQVPHIRSEPEIIVRTLFFEESFSSCRNALSTRHTFVTLLNRDFKIFCYFSQISSSKKKGLLNKRRTILAYGDKFGQDDDHC